MNYKILFRSSLSDEAELKSASKYFDILTSRIQISIGDFIIPRYSLLPFAKEFFEDVAYVKARTINSYQQYKYIADMKNYISDLGDLTPRTWDLNDGIIGLPDNCSFVLKGETNSKKFQWNEMMFAKNKQALIEVQGKLLKDSLIGEQTIYAREYVPLKTFAISDKGLPITNEYRCFVVNKQIISSGYYWSNYYQDLLSKGCNLSPSQIPQTFLDKVLNKVSDKCYAYVLDVAQTESNDWMVVELNAFEQSGLSENNPDILYNKLKVILERFYM